MNQILKDNVYTQGNQAWVDYAKEKTGMNIEEREVFQMLHDNETDLAIQMKIGSRSKLKKLEDSVRKKLLWFILYCVDYTMKNDN